jgi:RNA polymerase sigma-70 factor, ECF subfamily
LTLLTATEERREGGGRPGRAATSQQHRPPSEGGPEATETGPDPAAVLRSLYAQYWTDLVAYVNGLLADRHLAEEIAQETMLRAWRNADKLTPDRGSIWGWLRRVSRNLTVDRIRYQRARPTEVDEAAVVPRAVALADHSSDVVDFVYIAEAITRLQPVHRAVLYQVYFCDRTCAEAAKVLGVPVGTVKSRVYYGLRQLRAALAQDGFEPASAVGSASTTPGSTTPGSTTPGTGEPAGTARSRR